MAAMFTWTVRSRENSRYDQDFFLLPRKWLPSALGTDRILNERKNEFCPGDGACGPSPGYQSALAVSFD